MGQWERRDNCGLKVTELHFCILISTNFDIHSIEHYLNALNQNSF